MSKTNTIPLPQTAPKRPFYQQKRFWIEFAAGFIGWWVIFGLAWWLEGILGAPYPLKRVGIPVLLLLTFAVLVVTPFIRRPLAGGIWAAVAINRLILLLDPTTTYPALVPFFIKGLIFGT